MMSCEHKSSANTVSGSFVSAFERAINARNESFGSFLAQTTNAGRIVSIGIVPRTLVIIFRDLSLETIDIIFILLPRYGIERNDVFQLVQRYEFG